MPFLASLLDVYSRAELTWLGKLASRIEVPASSGEEMQYFKDMLFSFFVSLLRFR